jgi:hypothetical protein
MKSFAIQGHDDQAETEEWDALEATTNCSTQNVKNIKQNIKLNVKLNVKQNTY